MDMTKEVFRNSESRCKFSSLTDAGYSYNLLGKKWSKRFRKKPDVLFEDESNAYMYMLLSG